MTQDSCAAAKRREESQRAAVLSSALHERIYSVPAEQFIYAQLLTLIRFMLKAGHEYPKECRQTRLDIDHKLTTIIQRWQREKKTMIKVYCYSRCTTCKKALKWLDENGIEYNLIDIKENHPDEETLRKYHSISGLPLKKFFNTSGQIYRDMELSRKLPGMSADEQFALLASDGMIVKRPLLAGEDFVLTGFKEAEWKEKLLK